MDAGRVAEKEPEVTDQQMSQQIVQHVHEEVERHKVESVKDAFADPVRELHGKISEQREALAAVSEEFEGSGDVQELVDMLDETFEHVEQELGQAAEKLAADSSGERAEDAEQPTAAEDEEQPTAEETEEQPTAEETEEQPTAEETEEQPTAEETETAEEDEAQEDEETDESEDAQAQEVYGANGNGGQRTAQDESAEEPQDEREETEQVSAGTSGEGSEQ